MLIDLDWNNFLEQTDLINKNGYNKKEFLSLISVIQYSFYGFKIKINVQPDVMIMYIKYKQETWKVFTSYYNEINNLRNLKDIIKKDLIELNGSDELSFSIISNQMVKDWELDNYPIELVEGFVSNYIYELDKMKTFVGKKLQKKRNHLNFFNSQNHNITIKNIRDLSEHEIISYIEMHIKKYSESFRQYEIDVYKHYLNYGLYKDNRFSGCAIYIDNVLVGLTIGILNDDVYEVIIEKAERDIRGLYQYLITTNLVFNNINCKYMDRQDDGGIEALAKSKQSYHPLMALTRYNINKVKGWF